MISALELIPLNYVSEFMCYIAGSIDEQIDTINDLIGNIFFGGAPHRRAHLEAEVRSLLIHLGLNLQNGENIVYYMLPFPVLFELFSALLPPTCREII